MSSSKIFNAPLFKNVERRLLDELINSHSIIAFPEGMRLIHKDLSNQRAYILIEGKVSIRDDKNTVIGFCEGLTILGEISVLDKEYPMASVITQTNCKVLALTKEELWGLCEQSHAFTSNLLLVVVERLRNLSKLLEESKNVEETMHKKAYLDGSTGLLNRTWLQENAANLVNQHKKKSIPLSLILADIDYLKRVNDDYGYDTGDTVLRQIGLMMQSATENKSYSVRLNGDEMCVFLSAVGNQEAMVIAERLRSAIHKTVFKQANGQSLSVTSSFGVSFLAKDMTSKDLMKQADLALYEAKGAGRNRVHAFTEQQSKVS